MDVLGKLQLITVEPILFLFMLGSFTQMAIMQDLIYTKVCVNSVYRNECAAGARNDSTNDSTSDFLQTESNHWLLYSNVAVTVPAILACLYLGSWSCRYGPKLPLLLPPVGAALSCAINIVLSVRMDSHVGFLLLGQAVAGIFGASICVIMSCMSYVALVAPVTSRTARFVLLELMIVSGGTVGPFVGGILKEKCGFVAVFIFLLCVNLLLLAYASLRIRDIKPVEIKSDSLTHLYEDENESESEIEIRERKRSRRRRCGAFHIHHCVDTLLVCFRKRDGEARFFILWLLLCAFFIMVCTAGEVDTAFFFTKDDPLRWNYEKYSYYSGVKHCLAGLGLLLTAPLLRTCFNPSDSILVLLGIVSKMAALTFLAFSKTTWMMFVVPIIAALSSLPMPALRSMLSKLMETNEHGKLFALVATVEQLCYLVGSVVFNALYPATRNLFHGFVFLLCDVFLVMALVIVTWIHYAVKRRDF